ncbi:MAG: hypothetical protein L6Q52_07645 [Rhodocyclaceae bacterium]|nr:hypothetical protein [Rhodocyclaceae bacterium]
MEQKAERVPVDKAERQRQKRIMLWCAAVAILGMPAAAITGWWVWWFIIPGAWFIMIMLLMQKLWRNWYHEEE